MFGQTFAPGDLLTIAVLVVLEGLLSIDNALVLGVMVQRVDPRRRCALFSYGLVGAFVLRLAMICLAAYLLKWSILKLAGGLYLVWVAGRHLVRGWRPLNLSPAQREPPVKFWTTVAAIELTDIAFAADSILAAVALVGPGPVGVIHPKLWVIVTGGMLGVVLMRFAAAIFARPAGIFPGISPQRVSAGIVNRCKTAGRLGGQQPGQSASDRLSKPAAPAMWLFWGAMVLCLAMGLRQRK